MKRATLALLILSVLVRQRRPVPRKPIEYPVLNGRIAYSLVDLEDIDGLASLFVRDPVGQETGSPAPA